MLEGLTPLDAAALATFFGVWGGYNSLFDGRFRRPTSINTQMIAVRRAWMTRLLARENRIMDSTLIGHSIHSATFFASTTIILLAGLVGVLGAAERVHTAAANISVLLSRGQALFELNVVLLIGIFVYAFFKFTWAIRQFNYFCAIIGSAPDGHAASVDSEFPHRMAIVLSHAVWQLNAGVRAHYFALASLGWFIHPVLFMAATVLMTFVLVRRQLFSPTARAIADHVRSLDPAPPSDDGR